MKQRPVLWFRRLSLVLAILGIVGGIWMIASGLFLQRVCPDPYVALDFTGTGGRLWICLEVTPAPLAWDPPAYPKPLPDFATVGLGIASILFFLWAYSLCLAVASRLEAHSPSRDASEPGTPS